MIYPQRGSVFGPCPVSIDAICGKITSMPRRCHACNACTTPGHASDYAQIISLGIHCHFACNAQQIIATLRFVAHHPKCAWLWTYQGIWQAGLGSAVSISHWQHNMLHPVCLLWLIWYSSSLTLGMLGNFHAFVAVCWLISKSTFSKNSFRITIWVSNSLDPDQDRQNVGPDLGPNCLQRLSADDKSRHQNGKS